LIDAQVVAEGLESLEQIDLLKQMGCTVGQGYLLGQPMPAGDILQFVGAQSNKSPAVMVLDEEIVRIHG
jgi:EAL domain-containing protein (putative c-di-GMP-specific phosphodiesterase class I)